MSSLDNTMKDLNDMANMKDFGKKKYNNPTNEGLLEAAKPLIQYMAEHWHPHTICIVDATHAEVLEGQQVVRTEEFLRD